MSRDQPAYHSTHPKDLIQAIMLDTSLWHTIATVELIDLLSTSVKILLYPIVPDPSELSPSFTVLALPHRNLVQFQ